MHVFVQFWQEVFAHCHSTLKVEGDWQVGGMMLLVAFIYLFWLIDMKKYKEIDVLLVFWHLIYKMVKKPFFISAH